MRNGLAFPNDQDLLNNAFSLKTNGPLSWEVPKVNSKIAVHFNHEDSFAVSSQSKPSIWIAPYLQGNPS